MSGTRGAAKFLLERNVEPNALTRDIGRIFLGRDLQCAQCHDHPTIVDYEQAEYYGIYAFVNRSYLFEEDTKEKKAFVGEKAEGDTQFSSVFSPDDSSRTAPRLLGELTLDAEPRFEGEQAYVVAPSKKAAGVPKFSRRRQLARLITHPENEHFAKNVVNRLWKHMLGYGLVDPVDFHHSDNQPSHPALLEVLAVDFAKSGFDFRSLLKEIALSKIYQQSVDFSAETLLTNDEITRQIEQLESEVAQQEADLESTSLQELTDRLQARRDKVAPIDQAITESAQQLEKLQKENQTLVKTQADKQKSLAKKQSQLKLLQEATAAAKKVAESFPGDQSLAEKHTAYQQRTEPLSKEIESLESQLVEGKSKIETNQQQVKSQELRLIELRADRIGLADMVAEARGVLQHAFAQQREKKSQLDEKKQQLAAANAHRQYLDKLAVQEERTKYSTQLKAEINATAEQRAALAQSITEIDAKVSQQQNLIAKLDKEAVAANDRITERQAALDALKVAIKNALEAAGEIADQELDIAVANLNEKHTALSEQYDQDKIQAEKKQEELLAAQSVLKQQQMQQAEYASQQQEYEKREKQWADAIAAAEAAIAETATAESQLHNSWERRFAVRALVPLTPEQLAGSTIAALELKPRFQIEAEAEWQAKHKDKKPEEIEEAKKNEEIAQLIQKRLDQVTSIYVSMFAAPGGAPQDVFSATADQALFFANDGRVQGWLNFSEGSLLKRLESIENVAELADQMYLAMLSRRATPEEQSGFEAFLSQHSDNRNTAIRELTWSLLTSLEFRFNR